jgi:hypothetical protein
VRHSLAAEWSVITHGYTLATACFFGTHKRRRDGNEGR